MIEIKELRKRVEAGAKFLDVVKPGWKKKIDLKKLDLQNSFTCVIGEVYGNFFEGTKELQIERDRNNLAEILGFDMPESESYDARFATLTRIWKNFLKPVRRVRS